MEKLEADLKAERERAATLAKTNEDLAKKQQEFQSTLDTLKEKKLLDDDNKPSDVEAKLSVIQKELEEARKEKEAQSLEFEKTKRELAITKRDKSVHDWCDKNSKDGKVYDPQLVLGLLHDEIPEDVGKRIPELEKTYPSIARAEKFNGPRTNDDNTAKNKGNPGQSAIDRATEKFGGEMKNFREGLDKLKKSA